MEFNEKLQKLRKNKGLTQEELAEALYVSRTAVSKWESGRGYPNIDSLKEISRFFSVTVDDLLSGEKLLFIAEKENKSNMRELCNLLFGIVDLFSLMLIFLPIYPNVIDGYVYSVNLLRYSQITPLNKTIYWIMFVILVISGIVEILLKNKSGKSNKTLMDFSMISNVLMVMFLALTRETYAIIIAFLLVIMKGIILFKYIKASD